MAPIAPCDTLLWLADRESFRSLWSGRVVEEALRALERVHREINRIKYLNRFRSINEAFEEALVDGWETLEAAISLSDPDDRHVVAAALRGR